MENNSLSSFEENRIRKIIQEELRNLLIDFPKSTIKSMGCRVCGRGKDGKPDNFVCSRNDCPSRITC
jgi:hypothetical protein